jgi:hypothetical protein
MSEAQSDKAELIEAMQAGWERLQAFIDSYSEEQLVTKTDAAGWTAKDHLMHLAVWEGSMIAVMDKQPRWKYMDVPEDVWATLDSGSYDEVNEVIRKNHADLTLAEVRAEMAERHRQFMARVEALPAEDMQLPYSHFLPSASDESHPLIGYLSGNSFDHYDEHIPWMRAIIEG